MLNKTKELRSDYHAAPKPEPILTLFGIEYDAWTLTSLLLKASFLSLAFYLILVSLVYLCQA